MTTSLKTNSYSLKVRVRNLENIESTIREYK